MNCRVFLAAVLMAALAATVPACASADGGLGDGPCPSVGSCVPECPLGCVLTQYGPSGALTTAWYECQADGTDATAVCPTCASCAR